MAGYDIQDTLTRLASSNRLDRQRAWEIIKQSEDGRFVTGLIDLLQGADSSLQKDCVSLLGHIGDDQGVPVLLDLLNTGRDEAVRLDVIIALGRIGDDQAVPVLLDVLHSSTNELTQAHTIIALGRIGDDRAEDSLLPMVTSDNSYIRQRIATALGGFSSEKCVQALIGLLNDADKSVRGNAAQSLGEIGDSRAISALGSLMSDGDRHVRMAVVTALTQFDDDAIVALMLRALEDYHPPVRAIAAEKLGDIGTPLAYEPLLRAKHPTNRDVNRAIDAALAKLEEKQVSDPEMDITLLINLLPTHDDPDVIAAMLESIGTPDALAAVEAWRSQNRQQQSN